MDAEERENLIEKTREAVSGAMVVLTSLNAALNSILYLVEYSQDASDKELRDAVLAARDLARILADVAGR